MTDIYDARGRLLAEPDDWGEPIEPRWIPAIHRRENLIWVRTYEGHWLRFSGATAALEAFEEAERRYQEYAA